jgi:outer membrane receptor for ferrienterochelin and colicin
MTQIFVDGFLVNRRMVGVNGNRPSDFRIDDVVSPASVEGIEVYRGLSTVPPEFLNPDAVCGVIAIWTRRGGGG